MKIIILALASLVVMSCDSNRIPTTLKDDLANERQISLTHYEVSLSNDTRCLVDESGKRKTCTGELILKAKRDLKFRTYEGVSRSEPRGDQAANMLWVIRKDGEVSRDSFTKTYQQ